jgi:hypothetical protein
MGPERFVDRNSSCLLWHLLWLVNSVTYRVEGCDCAHFIFTVAGQNVRSSLYVDPPTHHAHYILLVFLALERRHAVKACQEMSDRKVASKYHTSQQARRPSLSFSAEGRTERIL